LAAYREDVSGKITEGGGGGLCKKNPAFYNKKPPPPKNPGVFGVCCTSESPGFHTTWGTLRKIKSELFKPPGTGYPKGAINLSIVDSLRRGEKSIASRSLGRPFPMTSRN